MGRCPGRSWGFPLAGPIVRAAIAAVACFSEMPAVAIETALTVPCLREGQPSIRWQGASSALLAFPCAAVSSLAVRATSRTSIERDLRFLHVRAALPLWDRHWIHVGSPQRPQRRVRNPF